MAVLSREAILNNRNISYRAIVFREAIVLSCSPYFPITEETLTNLGAIVGMSKSTASKCVSELEDSGEIAYVESVIYLLKLEKFQLDGIEERKNYHLLETLAVVGCVDAAVRVVERTENPRLLERIIEKYKNLPEKLKTEKTVDLVKKAKRKVAKIELNVATMETSDNFLLQFFLFSSFQNGNKGCQNGNGVVAKTETNVANLETTYKELNVQCLNPNDYREEEETLPPQPPPKNAVPKKSKKTAQESQSRDESFDHGKTDINWRELRPDIPSINGKEWLDYLSKLPKYHGLDVLRLHEKMLKTCKRKGSTPSRARFLRWLASEITSIPIVESANSPPAEFSAETEKPMDEDVLRTKAREILQKRTWKFDNDSEVWRSFLSEIGKRLNPQILKSWFAPIGFEKLDTTRKLLHVRTSEITKDWISRYYAKLIGETLQKIGLGEYSFEFKLPETSAEMTDFVETLTDADRQRFLQIFEEEESGL